MKKHDSELLSPTMNRKSEMDQQHNLEIETRKSIGWIRCLFVASFFAVVVDSGIALGQTESGGRQLSELLLDKVAGSPDNESATETDANLFDGSGEESEKSNSIEPLTEEETTKVKEALEALSASEFAERERAAAVVMSFGKRAIPVLRKKLDSDPDAEVQLRTQQILKQLADGDLQARIEAFLAGQEVVFKGWPVVQRLLGSSSTIRELFVEIMQRHPYVGESMEGTARDRAIALEKTLASVQPRLNSIRDEPVRADIFSLLLVAVDPEVPIPIAHEQVVIRLCQRRLVTEVRRDVQLAGPFAALMNRWVLRGSVTNREEILLIGMEMDLSATLPLAVTTLEEVEQPDLLATSFQAITKFGGPAQIASLLPFFDDTRLIGAPAIGDDPSLAQLGDIAMVAVALLFEIPLDEVGIMGIREHEARGFLLPRPLRVFKDKPEASRQAAREQILAKLGSPVIAKPQ